jgi:hypothetical protein
MKFVTFDGLTEFIRLWDAIDTATEKMLVIYLNTETGDVFATDREEFERKAQYVQKSPVS